MHAPLAAPAACENCGTALLGGYCHACGQHAVNPMRHFAHAVEEVFESFWHLDGRVFRTLRDLFVPGRVACNYLAGQRVRYIAPLRLFVILTLLTFFVGQLAAGVGGGADDAAPGAVEVEAGAVRIGTGDGGGAGSIQKAKTEAEVRAALSRELAELAEARRATATVPFVAASLDRAEAEVKQLAEQRIVELGGAPGTPAVPSRPGGDIGSPSLSKPSEPAAASSGAATAMGRASTVTPAGADEPALDARQNMQKAAAAMGTLRDPKVVWHERDNPVDIGWLPGFADTWLNHRMANVEHNAARIEREGQSTVLKLMLAAVPPALFVLVPVFALLLRALYPFTARGYLEHLVVALYSHAFMLVVLLATFVLILLRATAGPAWIVSGTHVLQGLLWTAVPVYLFVTQHRVYRQHWLATLGKYLVLGVAYLMLVMMVVAYSAFAGISSGA